MALTLLCLTVSTASAVMNETSSANATSSMNVTAAPANTSTSMNVTETAGVYFGDMTYTKEAGVTVKVGDDLLALLKASQFVDALKQLRKAVMDGCSNCVEGPQFLVTMVANKATGYTEEYTFDAEQNAQAAQMLAASARRGAGALAVADWEATVVVIGTSEEEATKLAQALVSSGQPTTDDGGLSGLAIGLIVGGVALVAVAVGGEPPQPGGEDVRRLPR